MADYSSDSDATSVSSKGSAQTPGSPRSEGGSGNEGTPVSPSPSPPPVKKTKSKKSRKPSVPKEEASKPKKRGRPPKAPKDEGKTKRSKKESDSSDTKVKRARKTREVPDKPRRFVTDEDNFLKYKAYLEYLLKYETPKQWADRQKKEKRRQTRMARDWKKKGDIDIAATVKNYTGFLDESGHDFAEFEGKWLTTFGIEDVFSAKDLKKVDLSDKPIQFRAAHALFLAAKEAGHKPLGIYAAKLDTYDKSGDETVVSKGEGSPEGDSVYVGPRNSLQGMAPHPLSLPTKLKEFVDRTDDMKLGVGEEEF